MGCDFHQFFTKHDLDAGNLVFIDMFDEEVPKDKVTKLIEDFAIEVDVDYVLTCTVDANADSFHYWPLDSVDNYLCGFSASNDEYTKLDYLADIRDEFGKLCFCPDEKYLDEFGTKFTDFWFPKSCKEQFDLMRSAYVMVKDYGKEMLLAKIKYYTGIVKWKCRKLLDENCFMQQTFYDLNQRSEPITVKIADGKDAMLIAAVTC